MGTTMTLKKTDTYFIIYRLFLNRTGYTVLNGRMVINEEFERKWEEGENYLPV